MLSQYLQLKFNTVIIPNSLQEKQFGGTVLLAGGFPVSALDIEFKALKLAGTILGFTIGGALDKDGKSIQGVYQVTWWNPQNNKNSNNTKRTKHP